MSEMQIPEKMTEEQLLSQINRSTLIIEALQQAKQSHRNQYREDNQPYLTEHIYPVTKMVIDYYGNSIKDEIIAADLLHDALEDDPAMTDKIFLSLFGDAIYKMVKPLTKPNGPKGLGDIEKRKIVNKKYFEQLKKAPKETKIIKIIDRINNLYWAHTFGDKMIKQYIDETENFYLPFARDVDEMLHKEMKRLLEKIKH